LCAARAGSRSESRLDLVADLLVDAGADGHGAGSLSRLVGCVGGACFTAAGRAEVT
jgi:hypothetical protein